MPIPAENIRDWRNHDVVDQAGDKIGSLEAVYFDTASDEPSWVSIQIGILNGKRLVFAPLVGAVVSPDWVKVQVLKKQVKDGPSIGLDGELTKDEEPAIFQHFGITYTPGAGGERLLGRR